MDFATLNRIYLQSHLLKPLYKPPIRGKEGTDSKDGKDAELPFDIWAGSLAEYNALPYEQRNDPEFVHLHIRGIAYATIHKRQKRISDGANGCSERK